MMPFFVSTSGTHNTTRETIPLQSDTKTVSRALRKFDAALALRRFTVTQTLRDMFYTINAIASRGRHSNNPSHVILLP